MNQLRTLYSLGMTFRKLFKAELLERLREDVPIRERSIPPGDHIHHLPYQTLHWKEFELLILDLVDTLPEYENSALYGVEGSKQDGIDIYAPLTEGGYDVLQCKQVQEFTPYQIREMVDLFLGRREDGTPYLDKKGNPPPPFLDDQGQPYPRWPERTRKFILAISRDLDSTAKDQALLRAAERLKAASIQFEFWTPHRVDRMIKAHPEVVDRHFSRFMVQAFCGKAAADALGPLGEHDRAVLQRLTQLEASQDYVRDQVQRMSTQGVGLLPDQEDRLVDRISSAIHQPETTTPITEKDPFNLDLEGLRALIHAGHGSADAALEKLSTLAPDVSRQPPAVQAKYHRLVGAYHYNLEHLADAAAAYHQAFELDPDALPALRLKGLAYLLEREGDRAYGYLEQAKRKEPDQPEISAMMAEALALAGRQSELEALERTLRPEQHALGLTLARYHLRAQAWARMRATLDILAQGPHQDDPQYQLLEGKYYLHQLIRKNRSLHGDLRNRQVELDPDVRKAHRFITQAANALDRGTGLLVLRTEALNAQQVLKCLTGKDRESVADAHAALRLDPSLTGTQFDLALAQLRLNDPAGALAVLSQFGDQVLHDLPQSAVMFAAAARRSKNPGEALRILDRSSPPLDEDDRLTRLNERVQVLLALERVPDARALVDAELSPDPLVEVTRARVALAEGNEAAARAHFERTVQLASGFQAATYRMDFSSFLESRRDTQAAAAVLQDLNWADLPSGWLEQAIPTLYSAGFFTAAGAAAEERVSRGPFQEMVAAVIHAHLQAMDGELDQALPELIATQQRWPDEPWPLMHLALLYAQIGNPVYGRSALHRLMAMRSPPYWMLMQASQAARDLHLATEARELAYRALRAGYDHEDTHVHFYNVMHDFPERTIKPTVRPETAVELQAQDGKTTWIVLTADPSPNASRQEHALDSPVAAALMSRRKGQRVQLSPSDDRRIVKVISKYVYAEHNWLLRNRDLFPTSERVQMFQSTGLEVLPHGIWDILRRQEERDRVVSELIDQGKYPATLLAFRQRVPETTLWTSWAMSGARTHAYASLPVELECARQLVASSTIVLHASALAVLQQIGLLRPLARQKTLIVTRQTFDDVKAARQRAVMEERHSAHFRLRYQNGHLTLLELQKEDFTRHRERLDALMVFLTGPAVRIKPVLGLTRLLEQNQEANFSVPSASTFLAADQMRLPVLCDDLTLGLYAGSGMYGLTVPSATTLAFVHEWHAAGQLTRAEYMRWTLALASAGHEPLVEVSTDLVNAVLTRSELNEDPAMPAIFRSISDAGTPLNEVVRNTALLLRQGLLHHPLPESRVRWMRIVLDEVRRDHPVIPFAQSLRDELNVQLELVPTLMHQALEILHRWEVDRWQQTVARPLSAD